MKSKVKKPKDVHAPKHHYQNKKRGSTPRRKPTHFGS